MRVGAMSMARAAVASIWRCSGRLIGGNTTPFHEDFNYRSKPVLPSPPAQRCACPERWAVVSGRRS